jgi:hypothetical protein
MRRTVLAIPLIVVAFAGSTVHAAMIQFLTPAGSSTGIAYGVDGLNVVGQDVAQRGFYYNGATNKYTVIQPPGGGVDIAARGISGNKIVGYFVNASGNHGFMFDGTSYSTFDHPLGVNGTSLLGISGNTIVGTYGDASKLLHGFLYDGVTYTTIDFPGAKATWAYGVSGNNVIGSYTDSIGISRGFLYNGSTFTTLNDPFLMGNTAAYGIDKNRAVGFAINSPFSAAFIYDGVSYNHPFGIELPLTGNHIFYGISGNRIVGEYNDRPFVYIIPEPSALRLAILSTAGLVLVLARRRIDRSLTGRKHA